MTLLAGTPLRYLTTWERPVPQELVLLEKRERFPGEMTRPTNKICPEFGRKKHFLLYKVTVVVIF